MTQAIGIDIIPIMKKGARDINSIVYICIDIYIDVLNPSYICHTHEAGCTSVSSAIAGSSHTVSGRFYTITAYCSSFHHDPNKLGVLLAEAAQFHDFV